MYTKRLIILVFLGLNTVTFFGQELNKEATADAYSYELYTNANWTELLSYGTQTLNDGIDFPLLRMRMGYAAFMMGNHSKSLKQYEKVYNDDYKNYTALYYCYLNNVYLNNTSAARYYAGRLDAQTQAAEKLESQKISEVGIEYSYKYPSIYERGTGHYGTLHVGIQLGYQVELKVGGAIYKQEILEPQLLSNGRVIKINQNSYYGKMIYTPSASVDLIGGFLIVPTKLNSVSSNKIATFGLNYHTPYIGLQGLAHFATVSSSSYNQFDIGVSTFPFGNLNLYTVSKGMFGKQTIFSQVAGFKIVKNIWLEGNATMGSYDNLIENDGLYLINDIDTKNAKYGGSIYAFIANNVLISINYSYEEKTKYKTSNTTFNQQSTTINLKWTL